MIRFLKFYKYTFKSYSFAFCVFLFSVFSASAQKYVVVLDAGHGGKDPGSSNKGYIEKKIALNVTLEVGKALKNNSLIDVRYTRKKDVFIELHKRAAVANNKSAALFVSIHCDSYKPRPAAHGASTYVLGLNGNEANMEIAKKENEVILLEDDYKKNYDYDPNSPESVIGLSVLQEENLDSSLAFAGLVQSNFAAAKRKNRSVKQANFLVLRETVMPSVLIELGFLTNGNEAKFLNSKSGQKKMAKAISVAIQEYIKRVHLNSTKKKKTTSKPVAKKAKQSKVIEKKAKKNTDALKNNKEVVKSKAVKPKNKVSVKEVANEKVAEVKQKTKEVSSKKKDEIAVAKKVTKPKKETKNVITEQAKKEPVLKKQPEVKKTDKIVIVKAEKTKPHIPVIEFKVQVAASRKSIPLDPKNFRGLKGVEVQVANDYYRYYYGRSSDYSHIKEYLLDVKDVGIKDAFVVAFKDGVKIPLKQALKK